MAEYYGQRATDGGLIITESAEITPDASAYQGAPGIYCDAQVAGWRKVTSAVHAKGGYIFLQLWHSGRVSHVDLTGGVTPVGPSVVPTDGILVFTAKGPLPNPGFRSQYAIRLFSWAKKHVRPTRVSLDEIRKVLGLESVKRCGWEFDPRSAFIAMGKFQAKSLAPGNRRD